MYNWNFYEGSRFSHYLKEMGVSFPDDMASFVIISYHRHLNGRELELEKRSAEIAEKRRLEYLEKIDSGKVIKEETHQREGGQ